MVLLVKKVCSTFEDSGNKEAWSNTSPNKAHVIPVRSSPQESSLWDSECPDSHFVLSSPITIPSNQPKNLSSHAYIGDATIPSSQVPLTVAHNRLNIERPPEDYISDPNFLVTGTRLARHIAKVATSLLSL